MDSNPIHYCKHEVVWVQGENNQWGEWTQVSGDAHDAFAKTKHDSWEDDYIPEVKEYWLRRPFWNQAMLTANMGCDTVPKVI